MRATASCLEKGFIGRTMDEVRRYFHIVLSQENLKGAKTPYLLKGFHEPDSVPDLKIICDYKEGGFSKAKIDWVPPSTNPSPTENSKGHIRFHGSISSKLPPNRPDIHRSGYAAFRTKDRKPHLFGRSIWDIDPYVYIALRIKSDGRRYFVNLQTDTIVPSDIHQHRLYARRPGEWETVLIRWNAFVRTNHGAVTNPQSEIMRSKLRTIGIGLIDGVDGPFDLSIERIWATNMRQKEEYEEDGREQAPDRYPYGQLADKHGQKIKWSIESRKQQNREMNHEEQK